MTRERPSRARSGIRRLIVALAVVLVLAPRSPSLTQPRLYAAADPLQSLTHPTTADLQRAFAAVGTGHLPSDYPSTVRDGLVPTTLLEAVAWAESKWRQYDSKNKPLVSADGGYGIMQVTTGMAPGQLPKGIQSAIANNLLYNVGFGAQVLMQKLHLTPRIGNGDPSVLEHWYYALWAYNAWGWGNNPTNPQYTRVGTPDSSPWAYPYQERIFYYVAHPPQGADGRPLWKAIPVVPPSAKAIGADPGRLPEVAHPHKDSAPPATNLAMQSERGARFIADLTIRDGTVLQPGQRFSKTWRLQNDGTVTWGTGFRLMPAGGPDLGSDAGVAVGVTPPLATVDVAVGLVAPNVAGKYREYWQMVGTNGQGFGTRVWVSIVVAQGKSPAGTAAGSGTATPIGSSVSHDPALPTGTIVKRGATPVLRLSRASDIQQLQIASDSGDGSAYAGDVTIPDGTVLAPGAHFTKSWRLKNVGTTTWKSGYTWRFQAGTLMSSRTSIAVPQTAPGATAIVSVPMAAPSATGVYTSFWQMANPAGRFFPHQAWVNIVVKAGARVAPTQTPTATETPTATLAATIPPATAPATAPRNAQPTQVIAGGDGRLVASPWVGALAYKTYFSFGSTAGSMLESIGVYYPGTGLTHVRLTLYRPDAAERELQFSLAGGDKRVFALSRIAPSTGLSVAVEADRRVVAERVDTSTTGIMANPAVAATGRSWLFPAIPGGAPPDQQLVLFNPQDAPATVHLHVGVLSGGCCAADLTFDVPPNEQYVYDLGRSPSRRGPLSLQAGEAVAVERLAVSGTMSSILGIPGTTAAARTWYVPEVHGGSNGMVTLYNPGSTAALVTIRTALTVGSGPWLRRSIPARVEVRIPVSSLTSASRVSAQIDATSAIVAGSEWQDGTPLPVVDVGCLTAANQWSIIGGLGGSSTSDSLSIFNSSARASPVSIRVQARRWQGDDPVVDRRTRSWTLLAEPCRSKRSR